MRTRPLIVGKIALQSPTQRSLVPHHNVVQALASDGAHQPFRKGILPGRSRRSKHFLHAHISGHGGEVFSVDGISIAQQISRRLVPGKRFPHLLHVHSSVGSSVTPKCTTRRRSCDSTTKTNRTRKVAVGTVKKSMAAVCAR